MTTDVQHEMEEGQSTRPWWQVQERKMRREKRQQQVLVGLHRVTACNQMRGAALQAALASAGPSLAAGVTTAAACP